MKSSKFVSFLTTLLFVLFSAGSAFAVSVINSNIKLTVGTETADVGQQVTINITAEPVGTTETNVAGAAFTLQYDSSLTVTVNSDFFDTFINQGFTETDGLDINGTVDGYSQPLVVNEVVTNNSPTLMKIAAARKDGGVISAPTVLFTLQVSGSTTGPYPIELIPTNLENAAAGYASPTDIDLLVGAEAVGSVDEFPVRLFAADATSATYVENGSLTVSQNGLDSDGDGIDDSWEIDNFEDLTTADETSDYDQDGYSDLVEFQNDTDPMVDDAAGETGYNDLSDYRVTNLDVDGNGAVESFTDGFLLARYAFGITTPLLVNNAVDTADCTRCTFEEILAFLRKIEPAILDVDGNGAIESFTDGFLLARYAFGITTPLLVNNAVDTADCTRCTYEEILDYLNRLIPANQ